MSTDLMTLLQLGIEQGKFGTESRYRGVESLSLTAADGSTIVYLGRRFIPQPERLTTVGQHTVEQGERLDLVSAAILGDSLLYWRIADANLRLSPAELEVVGEPLRIALPEGL